VRVACVIVLQNFPPIVVQNMSTQIRADFQADFPADFTSKCSQVGKMTSRRHHDGTAFAGSQRCRTFLGKFNDALVNCACLNCCTHDCGACSVCSDWLLVHLLHDSSAAFSCIFFLRILLRSCAKNFQTSSGILINALLRTTFWPWLLPALMI